MLDLQFNSEEEFGRTINQQKLVFSQSIQNYLQQHSVSDFNIFFFKASPSACTSKEDEPFYDAHLLSYSVSNGTVSSSKHICECQVTETTREGLEIMLYQANLQPDMARMLVPNIDTITNRLVTSSPIAITA